MLRDDLETKEDPAHAADATFNSSLHPRLAWMLCYSETKSAQEVCRKFGISRKTFYKWLKRYQRSNGDTASLADQSRRPHRFPRATPDSSVELLKRIKEQTGFGQRRLRTYLQENYNISISERTIWKILKRIEGTEAGVQPNQAKTGSSTMRFSHSL